MRKYSVVFQQVLIIVVALVLPALLLFSTYANRITTLAVEERESSAQNTLKYVSQTFELLADTANAEAVRISSSEDYITAVSDFMQYEQVLQDSKLQEAVQDITQRLATVQFADERLRNIYLYTLATDYVITSDRGLLRFSALSDAAWLDDYMSYASAADILRTPMWLGRTTPESDLLSNGSRDSCTPVISYILPVRIANSRSLSLLIMNYYETKLAELINVDDENLVYIVDHGGDVVCHTDLNMLDVSLAEKAYVSAALESATLTGSYYENAPKGLSLFDDDLILYSYLQTEVGNWVLISENRLHSFTSEAMSATRGYLVAFMLLLLCGSMICLQATRRMIAPIALLSKKIQSSSVRNEVLLIEGEIQRLQKREQELLDGVQSSQSDVQNLYLLSLLRDTPWSKDIPIVWPHGGFAVVLLEIDRRAADQFTSSMLQPEAYSMFSSAFVTKTIVLDNRTCVMILNTDADPNLYDRIRHVASELRVQVSQYVELSFTIGIGLHQQAENGIYESYRQALTASRQRLLRGCGQTILYDEDMTRAHLYCYSKKCESMLLNALAAANAQAVDDALDLLRAKLLELDVDNILQAVNQLTGAIGAWLMENYAIDDIFEGGMQAWYAEEIAAETLEELLALLRKRTLTIVTYFEEERTELGHIDRIIDYINEHYMEDIDFGQMAEYIGISYSHARRVVKHKTNQSLLDVVNETRITQAKRLLKNEPTLSIKDIAISVGYHNIQSFNRFFKKFECITPSEYRANQN